MVMIEQEQAPVSKVEVPPEIKKYIEREVEKDIEPIAEALADQPEETVSLTIDFYKEVSLDERESTYRFYSWVKETYKPGKILYPASGEDIMPKLAFGKDKVTHTSLEEHIAVETAEQEKYFEELDEGRKVIADNIELPFAKASFQVVILTGSAYEDVGLTAEEIARVLDNEGLIILNQSQHTTDTKGESQEKQDKRISEFKNLNSLRSIAVPEEFQSSGASEIEFFLLQKD